MRRLATERRRIAEAMAEDIAQALERTRLVGDLESARVSGETERLRSALLSSVSHDLRSPLASIIGAASSLDNYAGVDERRGPPQPARNHPRSKASASTATSRTCST